MLGAPQSVLICGWADGKWMVDLLRALVRPLGADTQSFEFLSVARGACVRAALTGHAPRATRLCCLCWHLRLCTRKHCGLACQATGLLSRADGRVAPVALHAAAPALWRRWLAFQCCKLALLTGAKHACRPAEGCWWRARMWSCRGAAKSSS